MSLSELVHRSLHSFNLSKRLQAQQACLVAFSTRAEPGKLKTVKNINKNKKGKLEQTSQQNNRIHDKMKIQFSVVLCCYISLPCVMPSHWCQGS